MSTSVANAAVTADSAHVDGDQLYVRLNDGRDISMPLGWYPRLLASPPAARANMRLIGNGEGIHWPDVEEDISVDSILAGRKSSESKSSFETWAASRPRT